MAEKKGAKVKGSIVHEAERAAVQELALDINMIKTHLKRDIDGIYALLAEILSDPEMIDALAKVVYKRYQEFRESKKDTSQLPMFEEQLDKKEGQ